MAFRFEATSHLQKQKANLEQRNAGGAERPEINIEQAMRRAATYEELLTCWSALNTELTQRKAAGEIMGEAERTLNHMFTSISKPPYECDSAAKRLFEEPELRQRLVEMNIPEEFVLHTVRVGALKGALTNVERTPSQSVALYGDASMQRVTENKISSERLEDPEDERKRLVDMIRRIQSESTLDGYSWANDQLRLLGEAKKATQAGAEQRKREETARNKESAIARIQQSMHEPNFHVSREDAELLRPDFALKLARWKFFLESSTGQKIADFCRKYGDEEITVDLFTRLKADCDADLDVQELRSGKEHRPSLPLEIINPNSGWYAVLLINKKTKLRDFTSAAHGNMNSWFVL